MYSDLWGLLKHDRNSSPGFFRDFSSALSQLVFSFTSKFSIWISSRPKIIPTICEFVTILQTDSPLSHARAIRREGVWWRGVEEAALLFFLGRGYPLVCQLEPAQQKFRNRGQRNRHLSPATKILDSTGPGGSYFLKFGQVCATKGLKNDTLFETQTQKLTPNWTEKQKLTMTWDGVVSVTS